MSKDGYLPDNVTHQMIEGHFGRQEDEGVDVVVCDGRHIVVRLIGQNLSIEIFDDGGDDGNCVIDDLEFNLAEARLLARAINERVM